MRWNPFHFSAPRPAPPPENTSLLGRVQEYSMPHVEGVRAMLGDFQDFIQQGNMIDLAVGLILGSSFSAILNSFVVDILSPVISLFSERSLANYYWPARCPASAVGCTDKTWETWKQARDAGAVTINYGLFVENVMNFLINAVFLFFAVKKVFEVVFKRNVLVKKQCPYCKEFVKGDATRCKECGSDIDSPRNARGG